MDKCKAKRNVRFTSPDNRFVNFQKDNVYRCIFKTDDIILITDDGKRVICDIDTFDEEFELVS